MLEYDISAYSYMYSVATRTLVRVQDKVATVLVQDKG